MRKLRQRGVPEVIETGKDRPNRVTPIASAGLTEKRPRGFLTREVLFKRGLKQTNERRAIRWLGIFRKILMDPTLAEGPDDLFWSAGPIDYANHRRMTGPPPKAPAFERVSKKVNRRDWERE